MKRIWAAYVATVICLTAFIMLAVTIFSPLRKEQSDVVLPVPEFLARVKNNQVTTINIFLPLLEKANAAANPPQISGKAALVYDLTTQKTLFEKDPTARLPMASLTKITTAIVALENKKDDAYTVSKEALVGEDSMGLSAGEVLTLEELLHGLMLPSGNDAAEVLAAHYPGGRERFIAAMNDKVKALGLSNTNFTNPSGLQGDGEQYTTAYDLMILTKYALENFSLFRKIVATANYEIPYSENHKAFYLENETNLLRSYPGVKGVKTGYTPEADLCLVTYLEYKDHNIIAVLLGSSNRRSDMQSLLDFGLRSMGITPPAHGL